VKQGRCWQEEQTSMCNGLAEGAIQWRAIRWRAAAHRITGSDFDDCWSVKILWPVVNVGLREE